MEGSINRGITTLVLVGFFAIIALSRSSVARVQASSDVLVTNSTNQAIPTKMSTWARRRSRYGMRLTAKMGTRSLSKASSRRMPPG